MSHRQLRTVYVNFKEIPHSMIPKLFTRRELARQGGWGDKKTYLCIKVTYSPFSLKSQRRTYQHDTPAVHTKNTTFLLKMPKSCQKYPVLANNTQFLKKK